jgi:3-hydroxypropanoate dehydrogenase
MVDQKALDALFLGNGTYDGFLDEPVTEAQLRRIHDILKWGPTSANSQPMRILFLRSKEARERLRPAMSPGNLAKTMAAPMTAIIAYDSLFYEHLPKQFLKIPTAIDLFRGPEKKAFADINAFRNGTLQGAYFILAVRAVGLDCGAMSGFDNAKVDAAFFPDGRLKSNFLANIGRGDPAKKIPRNPRLAFEEACSFL